MKNTKTLLFISLALLILGSCTIEKRLYNKGFHLEWNKKYKSASRIDAKQVEGTEENKKTFARELALAENSTMSDIVVLTNEKPICLIENIEASTLGNETITTEIVEVHDVCEQQKNISGNVVKFKKTKGNHTNNNNMKNSNTLETKSGLSEMYSATDTQNKQKRKTARTIGGALLLMAVLAGISIPAVGSLAASIGLVGVFLLDVVVSLGIIKYHKKEKPKLAKKSGILRLIYTAFLGVGIGYSFGGNVSMFNSIWGVGLIVFGVHLISLGILFNNNGGKKWVNILIKSLLIAAGIGYIIQYVGILLVPNPIGFAAAIETIFILPMILGEVFYALWMLIKGGKVKSK